LFQRFTKKYEGKLTVAIQRCLQRWSPLVCVCLFLEMRGELANGHAAIN